MNEKYKNLNCGVRGKKNMAFFNMEGKKAISQIRKVHPAESATAPKILINHVPLSFSQ